MCGSMVDIQSATAEIRRGKKKKKQDKNIMSASATQGGHNKAAASPSHTDGAVALSMVYISMMQSYSAGCANVHGFLGHQSPHSKRHLDWFDRFCTVHGREFLHFTMGCPLSRQIAPSRGVLYPYLIMLS